MNSIKLTILLVVLGIAVCDVNICIKDLRLAGGQFKTAINKLNNTKNVDTFIDDLALSMKGLPDVIEDCGDKFLADKLRKNMPDNCVDDISKALQIGNKMIGETDNEIAFAFDLARMERIYDRKIKKQCPSFQNVTLKQILKKGECAQASYDFSLLVQNFLRDIENGQENKAVDDFVIVLQELPSTLDKCGQTDLAEKVRRDLPRECLTSLDVFGRALVELEYHYDHLEWIYKNFPRVYKDFRQITYTCPIFG